MAITSGTNGTPAAPCDLQGLVGVPGDGPGALITPPGDQITITIGVTRGRCHESTPLVTRGELVTLVTH